MKKMQKENRKTAALFLAAVAALALLVSGCGKSAGKQGGAAVQGDGLPLGKYNPPITLKSVKTVAGNFQYEEGDSLDDNPWTRLYRDKLGIQLKWEWTVPTDEQYHQKLAASIASGDLPDVFDVNALELDMLVQSGLIYDLTDLWQQYASPFMKDLHNSAPAQTALAVYGGKLMAIPNPRSISDGNVLWVRQDWLQKLGLPNPSTMQDVIAIAEAFAARDPDGNGRNDTAGLLIQKDFVKDASGNIADFMAGYGAYPQAWIKDGSGNIAYGGIQPEVKTALGVLADMYGKGSVNREFSSYIATNVYEQVLANKAGLIYAAFWFPLQVKELEIMHPEARLFAYPLPSLDGKQPAKQMRDNPAKIFTVVNKKYAHPEAIIKVTNLCADTVMSKPKGSAYDGISNSIPHGYEYHLITLGSAVELLEKNLNTHRIITEAVASGDDSKIDGEMQGAYNSVIAYNNNDRSDPFTFGFARIFAPGNSAYAVMDVYMKNNLFLMNEYNGAPTPTMASRQSSLEALRDETYTKIIMGASPLSAFDTFVSDWKRQGGDDITKELNDRAKQR